MECGNMITLIRYIYFSFKSICYCTSKYKKYLMICAQPCPDVIKLLIEEESEAVIFTSMSIDFVL